MKKKNAVQRLAVSRVARACALVWLAPLSMAAHACSEDSPYIGSVCAMVTSYCPQGYLPANGQVLQINTYQALYSLVGNVFGGTAQAGTFGLPNLNGRTIMGTGLSPVSGTVYQRGQVVGSETVTLNATNIAPHTHPASAAGSGSIAGTISLPVAASAAVSGQNVSGAVTVNGLNGSATPTGSAATPSSTANTVGKVGLSQAFYPQGSSPVAMPSSHNLTVPASTAAVTGTASGPVSLPVSGITMTVGPNVGGAPASIMSPRMALTMCIAVLGIYPMNPN